VNTANTAYFGLWPTTATQRLRLLQVTVAIATAPSTAPVFALARSTARGTQSTTLAGLPFDTGDTAAIGTLDGGFSAAPTFTNTSILAVGPMAVTAGGGWVWDFRDSPVVLAVSNGLVVFNINASGATLGSFRCSMIWEE
jgi:hypothetical protein